jgi:ParB family transcriptional regulator, chromosome partitioning protein
MKAAERLKGKFGATMRESVKAERPMLANAPTQTSSTSNGAGKYDGTAGLKRALAIPVDRIVPDPNQPRKEFEETTLADLAASLKARGQLQPIRVRWDDAAAVWVIVTGERRWRAATLAGLTTLQCIEGKEPSTADKILEDQLIENCIREDLKPVERAHAFKTLMDARGMTYRTLAEQLHISAGAVSQALSLLKLPTEVQGRVDSGELAATVGYAISALSDPVEQVELAGRVVAEGLSRAETVEAVKRVAGRSKSKGRGARKGKKVTEWTRRTEAGPRVCVEYKRGLDPATILAALAEATEQVRAEIGESQAAA